MSARTFLSSSASLPDCCLLHSELIHLYVLEGGIASLTVKLYVVVRLRREDEICHGNAAAIDECFNGAVVHVDIQVERLSGTEVERCPRAKGEVVLIVHGVLLPHRGVVAAVLVQVILLLYLMRLCILTKVGETAQADEAEVSTAKHLLKEAKLWLTA